MIAGSVGRDLDGHPEVPMRAKGLITKGATALCLLTPGWGAAGGGSGEPASEVDQVRCAEIAFSRAVETGDWEAFASHIHPRARFAGWEASGPEDVTARWRGAFGSGERRIRWRPRSVEILEPGSLALSRGPYRVVSRTSEGESESWGSFNSIWWRTGEGWRVVFDLGSEGLEEGDRELLLSETTGCPD
jgi:ketosteroid isomerase-like protein